MLSRGAAVLLCARDRGARVLKSMPHSREGRVFDSICRRWRHCRLRTGGCERSRRQQERDYGETRDHAAECCHGCISPHLCVRHTPLVSIYALPMSALPRHLQLLWDVGAPTRPGRQPSLSIHDIGRAAVDIADRGGLAAVTMKAVAGNLGLSTMSLYRYVDSREALLEVMIESAATYPPADLTDPGISWREATHRWAHYFAEGIRLHPWTLDLAAGTDLAPTPKALAWVDVGLRCLAGAGLRPAETLTALLCLDGVIRGAFRQSRTASAAGRSTARGIEYTLAASALVAERFPGLVAHAADLTAADPDALSTAVLDSAINLVLDGVEAGRPVG